MNTKLLVIAAVVVLGLLVWRNVASGLPDDQALRIREALDLGATLVDVRTEAEYAAGHVEGAINVPLGVLTERLGALGPKDRQLVLYCRSGSRSGVAAKLLRARGFEHVLDMKTLGNWQAVQAAAAAR